MSKLDELIQNLCPNGVEYKKIKEVTEMKRGSSLTKKNAVEGVYPVISGGRLPAFYCDKFNREGETITVAGSGIGAGYVQYWNEPIFANDCFTLKGNNQVIIKFVYYSLKSIQKQIYETKKGGGVPHCHISSIENLEIPVPPLPIQEEIVRILDNFTELTAKFAAELTEELTARRKQYEYYRDELFNFGSEIESYKLIELCDITRGKRVVKSQLIENGDYPVFQNTLLPMGYFNQYNCDESSSYVVSAGSAGEVGFCLSKSWMADDCLFFINCKNVQNKFIYYFLKSKQEYIKTFVRKASVPRLSREVIENLMIPLPSLEEQQRIVDILDKFDAYCNDLTQGLHAEIELRKQQYEYYRDKLLSFKEIK